MKQTQYTKDYIKVNHVRVVHLFDKYDPRGGITVAYKPTKIDYKTGRHKGIYADVAASYCSYEDQYSRVLGTELAVARLAKGHSLRLPIYARDNSVDFMPHPVYEIKRIFGEY